jgi:integrase
MKKEFIGKITEAKANQLPLRKVGEVIRAYYGQNKDIVLIPNIEFTSVVVKKFCNNKSHSHKVGDLRYNKWRELEKRAVDYISNIVNGRYQSFSNITVNEFKFDVVWPYSEKNHKDSPGFKQRLQPFIEAHGNDYVRDITKLHFIGLLNRLSDGRSSPTLARYLAAFSKFMSMAVDHEIVDSNICKGIKKPSENAPRIRSLYPKEAAALIKFAFSDTSPIHALALLLCLFTALRPSNIKPIELSWLKQDLTELHLPDSKGGRPLVVHLNQASIEIIKLAMVHSDGFYLFPGRNEGSPIVNITKCVNRIRKAVQKETNITEHFQLRDLRRTHASMQLRVTGDVRLVQQTLAHRDIKTTLVYAHHRNDKLLEASEKTAVALLGGRALSTYLPK